MTTTSSNARLAARFSSLAGRAALIPYVTAGDPLVASTPALMHALAAAGADVIELGVPFSDPMADGPVIQQAGERAIAAGVSLESVLGFVAEFRRQDTETPVVLMGYANPVECMGQEAFVQRAAQAGVDGVLTVDYTPEESAGFAALLGQAGLDPIYLLAPTTPPERIRLITAAASGYVYYVSLKGVTGAATLDVPQVAERIASIRAVSGLPIGVGFGIKDASSAAAVAAHADGVVVGSVLVDAIGRRQDDVDAIPAALAAILQDMRQAMDRR